MADHTADNDTANNSENAPSDPPRQAGNVDDILKDPVKRAEVLRKLRLPDPSVLTPSGKAIGGGGLLPPMWCPFPLIPPWNPTMGAQMAGPSRQNLTTATDERMGRDNEETEEEDVIELLEYSKALEFVEFDPTVEMSTTWRPTSVMLSFLEKHFNRCLTDDEKAAILTDFPKPNTAVLQVPKLDEDVKEQLKKKGKDPHFGQERVLYKLQDSILEVSGPLMCLWADLTNPAAEVSPEQILLLIQHALVLLGNASHAVTLERRRIAWGRINPSLKSLASEEYQKREDQLFGPGFLEKASKKLETQKALAKVSADQTSRKRQWDSTDDKSDLRRFLSRGAPAKYGGRSQRRSKPYKQPYKTQQKPSTQLPSRPVQDKSSQ